MAASNVKLLSVAAIKDILKGHGMSQAGDKGTLIHRLKLKEDCITLQLTGKDDPCTLSAAELKKAAAKMGVSPIGSPDEILSDVVAFYKANSPGPAAMTKQSTSTTTSGAPAQDPVAVAQEVLRLSEFDDYEGIMNINNASGGKLSAVTPHNLLRKAYLKLSLMIHPDKLQKQFAQATTAFQALVRAFELITAPVMATEDTSKATKSSKAPVGIARSNEGCYRTRVKCPRCQLPWSEGSLDGNPDYVYNFLMQGLKQYTCSTCLCEFGCMTAMHICPFCHGSFDYSPQDYHRKVTCGNAKCDREFGFMMYHASNNVINTLKATLKDEQERRTKARQSKLRRKQRSEANSISTRGGAPSAATEADEAFCLGLNEECPRCGESGLDMDDINRHNSSVRLTVYDVRKQHIACCNDAKKQRAHEARKSKSAAAARAKEMKQGEQEEVQQLAAWEFLGSDTSQLWLLEENNLKKKAKEFGIDETGGGKLDLIEQIVSKQAENSSYNAKGKRGIEMVDLTDGVEKRSTALVTKRRQRLTSNSVSTNLYGMSLDELVALCLSHGFRPRNPNSKADVIEEIEDELIG